MLETAEIQKTDFSSEELKIKFNGQLLKMAELTAKSINKVDHLISPLEFILTHCSREAQLNQFRYYLLV